MNKGVAGFRFDAITTLFEDPQWRDDKEMKDKDGKSYLNNYGDVTLDDAMTNNLPEVYTVLQGRITAGELRTSANHVDQLSVVNTPRTTTPTEWQLR